MRPSGELGDRVADRARRGLDPTLAVLVFAVSVSYLAALPLYLGHQDEAHYLHEAKRVLDGDRLYRDIFELTTPGWVYLLALLFKVFGVTLATARTAAAVIHAGTAAVLFIVCRRLAVRRGLALACAATYLFVCPSIFPVASQHWLATFLGVVLLWLCLRPPGVSMSLSLGVVVGLAIAVHQARGLAMGLGVAAFLIVDAFLLRRDSQPRGSALGIAFAAGLLIVGLPLLGFVVASAGLEPVWQALVVHPMQNYAGAFISPWGWSGSPAFSVRGLVKYLPLALVCAVPRVAGLWRPGYDRQGIRAGTVLIVLGVSSIYSIWYYPDFIHIAFIAPLFFVAMADAVERVLQPLPARIQAGVGWAVTLAILVPIGLRLTSELAAQSARRLTTIYQSAFGPVEVFPGRMAMFEKLAHLLNAVPSRTLYCHPHSGYTYLLVDGRNPTRFEFIWLGYNTPAQLDEVIDVLRTREVPYVQMDPRYSKARDSISAFIREHYELVPDDTLRRWGIWRLRRPGTPGARSLRE